MDPVTLLQPAATRVRDPVTGRSVWLAGLIENPRMDGDVLRFDFAFTPNHDLETRASIEEAVVKNLEGLGYIGAVKVTRFGSEAPASAEPAPPPSRPAPQAKPQSKSVPGMNMKGGVQPHGGPIQKKTLDGVGHIVAVASGKGGVGKSTIATNLAVAMAKQGASVGLLDMDVYGPSLPTMMNVTARPLVDENKKIVPVLSYGVRCMSIGLLVDPEEAMIWRGPMIMGVLRQFLQDTRWAGIDYLVVDLPPGTGDAQLSLIQSVDLSGAIIVTTPQPVALADAVRGITMFRKLDVPLLGLVENMAYYELPDGERDYVFGQGGGVQTAERYETEVLAQIPLQTALRNSCDKGLPAALGNDGTAEAFASVARSVMEKLPT